MRIILASLLAMIAVSASDTASAVEYPWCARFVGFEDAGTNCGFATWQQCRSAIWGAGGQCERNLFYHAAVADARPADRPRHKKRSGSRR